MTTHSFISRLVGASARNLKDAYHEAARPAAVDAVAAPQPSPKHGSEAEAVLGALVGDRTIVFAATDTHGTITMSRMARTGVPDEATIGLHFSDLFDDPAIAAAVDTALRGEAVHFRVEHTHDRTFEVVVRPRLEAGRITGIVGFGLDVSDQARLEKQLRHRADTDELTGLLNRRVFQRCLNAELVSSPERSALLMVDVDGFKHINDTYGHAAGDQVLQAMACRLLGAVRDGELVARLGGDEFGILAKVHDEAEAIALAERVGAVVAEAVQFAGGTAQLGASIGLVGPGFTVGEVATAMGDADLAMYDAKRGGGRQVKVFHRSMRTAYEERETLKRELALALERDEFTVVFQPIWDTRTGGMYAVEALVRWNHPERGELPPGAFLGVAEESGLISKIDHLVFRKACGQLAAWEDEVDGPLGSELSLSVNFSAMEFGSPDIITLVEEMLRRYSIYPSRLIVEITETAVMDCVESAMRVVHQLQELGVKVALDDFGTGYSSLAQLQAFSLDVLKIDRAFVKDAGVSAVSVAETIVDLAEKFGMYTVAEGIETVEQLAAIRTTGCRFVQGYLLGRPMAPAKLADMMVRTTEDGHPALCPSVSPVPDFINGGLLHLEHGAMTTSPAGMAEPR